MHNVILKILLFNNSCTNRYLHEIFQAKKLIYNNSPVKWKSWKHDYKNKIYFFTHQI